MQLKKRIFDVAVTNLECCLPKMEESVSGEIRNEVPFLVAASRCTLQTQRETGLCVIPLVCSQQEFGLQPYMVSREADGNLRGNGHCPLTGLIKELQLGRLSDHTY